MVNLLGILALTISSIIYHILGLNYPVLNYIVEFIDDTSIFMTIICIIFMIFAVIKISKPYKLVIISIIDIIIVNRLYSNKKILYCFNWLFNFVNLKKIKLAIYIIVFIIIFCLVYRKKYKKQDRIQEKNKNILSSKIEEHEFKTNDNNTNNMQEKLENDRKNDINEEDKNESIIKSTKKRFEDLKEKKNNNYDIYGLKLVNIFLAVICLGIILWSIMDYLVFNVSPLKISRPAIGRWIPDNLYYFAIICAAILLSLIIFNLFFVYRSGFKKFAQDGSGVFRVSAIVALILEVAIFFLINKIKPDEIINKFLSGVADNWFSSIFALVIFFLVLQIACIVFFHLFTGNPDNNIIVIILKNKVLHIELKIVKVTCGIIEGCVDLLDFVPDFFSTIGVLLLNKNAKEDKIIKRKRYLKAVFKNHIKNNCMNGNEEEKDE